MDEEELNRLLLQELEAVELGEDLLVAARQIAQKVHDRVRELLETESHPPKGLERDRRAALRHACNREAFCRLVKASADMGWRVRILEISREGLGILSSQRLGPGSITTIEGASLPPAYRKARLARVVHARSLPSGDWFVGCSLANELTEDELRAFLS